MLSRIISILFALIAGAAALIGLTRGRDNNLRADRSPSNQIDANRDGNPRQVGQTTVQVTPGTTTVAGDGESASATFSNTLNTDAGATSPAATGTTTSGSTPEDAIADDPTPGAPVPTSTPAANNPPPPAAPAPAPPAPPPVKAMW